MKKTNIAVIGYGGMGGWHTHHLLKSDVANLCGIYDIKEDRRLLAKEKGIRAYETLEELLGDPEVEIVTIAIPNDQHKPMAIKAMQAGKHVICEKPVTVSSADLTEIFEAAKKYDRLFTTHQNRRWDCDFLMMKEAYASGKLGDVFGIESRVMGSHGIPGDWRGKKEFGGGMVLDWGVHLIDQMLRIVYDKKIESIYCRLDHITNDEVDDGFKLDIYFEKGLTARIEVGTSHFIELPRYYMAGTNGAALINGWKDNCKLVLCETWEEKNIVPVVTSAGLTKTMAPRKEDSITECFIERPKSDVHDFYRNFCAAIRGEAEMIVTHDQLMRVMRVMEAAFFSNEIGAPVKMDDFIC